MDAISTDAPRGGRRLGELGAFLLAVIVGSVSGMAITTLLRHTVSSATAATVAVAVATTCTGATHARLVHGQSWRRLGPRIVVAAPLAYGVMRLLHVLLGS